MDELTLLKKKLNKCNYSYVTIEDEESITKIYNLFVNDIKFEPITGIECNYVGVYYNICDCRNYSEKYFLMGVKHGNYAAMYNLIGLYSRIDKTDLDLDSADKYFLMATNTKCDLLMYNLAKLYDEKRKHEKAEKYYLMAIQHGNIDAMIQLADMYVLLKKSTNYVDIEKYYLIAMNTLKNTTIIKKLAHFYMYTNGDKINGIKYYTMAANNEDYESICVLANHYKRIDDYVNAEKYFILMTKKNHCDFCELQSFFIDIKKDPVGLLKICIENPEFGDTCRIKKIIKDTSILKLDPVGLINFCIENKEFVNRVDLIKMIKKIFIFKLDEQQHKTFVEFLSSFDFLPEDKVSKMLRTLANSLRYHIDIMKLHFEYTVNGKGFKEAQNDFLNSIK